MQFSDTAVKRLRRLYKAADTSNFETAFTDEARILFRRVNAALNASEKEVLAHERWRRNRRLEEKREEAERLAEKVRRQKANERRQLAEIKKQNLLEKKRLDEHDFEIILQMIKDKKISVTVRYLKSVKDPERKKRVVEAICLGKVSK